MTGTEHKAIGAENDIPVSQADIQRSVGTLIETFGRDALARARAAVRKMETRSDIVGVEVWSRICRAIEERQGRRVG